MEPIIDRQRIKFSISSQFLFDQMSLDVTLNILITFECKCNHTNRQHSFLILDVIYEIKYLVLRS